jgi:general secretion pathway protein A
MYLTFYSLKKEPFHITPDPEFLYLSPSHKEALASIVYGIEQKKGFVAIIGAVGVGKTTILRSYLDSSDKDRLKIIYIFNSRLTFEGLLKAIYQDLDIPLTTTDTMEMVNGLYHVLIEEYRQGKTVVLVIDEAQNMPVDTLENLRMLSNLETPKDKLIQIVLIGQPEFEENLNLNQLRQLKQRIAIRSTILPLIRGESLEYIQRRVRKAGGHSNAIFTKAALNAIVRKARGIPRVINILCDNILITGFGYQQKPVSTKVVKEVISDLDGKKKQAFAKWRFTIGFSVIMLIIAVLLFIYYEKLPVFKAAAMGVFERTITGSQQGKALSTSNARTQRSSQKDEPQISEEEKQTSVRPKGVAEKQISTPVNVRPQNIGQLDAEKAASVPRKRTSVRPKDAVRPPPYPEPTRRTFQGKDEASRLTEDVSDSSDGKLSTLIKENNPQAANPNLIATGSTINLPPKPAGE